MAAENFESIPSYLAKLVDIAQRQLDSMRDVQDVVRQYMAHTDAKFAHAADMFVQLAGWVRGNGDEIVRTNERMAALGERMATSLDRLAERMAIVDERMVVTNERLLATEERIERLEGQIEQLLRALLRGRGDGEGATA